MPLKGALASSLTANAVVPISGTNMGAITLANGDTRMYYQDANNGSIIEAAISNAFNVGHFEASQVLVPSAEVRHNSPIAVSVETVNGEYAQTHTFFFSPDNVLSEYFWDDVSGTQGGPNCEPCITSKGFVGEPGNQMLYALAYPGVLRVGFVSAGTPNTVSEAINTGSGWSVASLTN
ncbi:hypothetical protein GYMLUDRAFT_250044 [Collybiopsis luxurians FD-317 M1]|uniref:Fucose-specific lectin n=1 Tax=Collybiopsis luxurians FD-317 M1 TaxID=944289 RepID=A0A0D0CFY4_9AGAR|nr:hypothetical protein GYMLUDRAFT_250044 [Collybiopsis luxurians FD-317 M1]